jgi:hypothetical protein
VVGRIMPPPKMPTSLHCRSKFIKIRANINGTETNKQKTYKESTKLKACSLKK